MAEKESSRSKWIWLFIVPLAGALVGAFLINYLFPQWFGPRDGLAVATTWPAMKVCDSTAVAGGPGADNPVISGGQTVDRAAVAAERGGGAWGSGNLTLLVTPAGDRQVVVSSITPEVEAVDEVPSWIFKQLVQCGEVSYREFELNLDEATLTDKGVLGGLASGDSIPEAVGNDAFVVDAEQAASVVVAAFACTGSYDFSLDIAYTVSGTNTIEHKKVGPYRVYGGDGVLANPDVDALGNPEAGPPTLPSRCAGASQSSASPSPTPSAETAVTAQSVQSALIPVGSCGDGATFGWDQMYPIPLTGGSGEYFDASGLGAGILGSRFVGAEDMNGDGSEDAVIVLDCTGTPKEKCCAGRTSVASFVVVLDIGESSPARVGDPLTPTHVDIAGGDGFRAIDGDSVTLEGNEIRAYERLVYPDELDPAEIAANEGWYRFALVDGEWSSTAE